MSTAFKEWQVICDALASGRQSIILRKGGIHEGRTGFSFAHDSFYLFPTKFHAQTDHVREGSFTPDSEWKDGDEFQITHHAQALFAVTLTDWEKVAALSPYHIYTDETLKDRFDWEGKGMASGSIHIACVRVSKLQQPITLTYSKRFGGCRSWVEMEEIADSAAENSLPVIADENFEIIQAEITGICSPT
ncbi:MAG: DUF1802 family protein [Akkermansiaceae bacterium]|jgi:hypothetical protein|nr:DUF1802 family protein [Akkermansiaceae bacterium]MDP4646645.1 DUF1802 family protein [Akkermansiaceae bacterium]MDP4721053.1 DUF1802 family protein [Akkermansiaceae bacterium]MDP4779561.1 DUF1802 family protein [Akkermansiaceae bacterium]MDP4846359.1 DUF1802 family protein [Akkermansiaceae bacterium]